MLTRNGKNVNSFCNTVVSEKMSMEAKKETKIIGRIHEHEPIKYLSHQN